MIRPAAVVAIGLLGACFSKPPDLTGSAIDAAADGSIEIDAPQPPACSRNPFSAPVVLTQFDGVASGEPTISGDLMEIFFTKDVGGGQYEVHYATRTNPTGFFTVFGATSFTTSNSMAPDPSITADGRLLVYLFDGGMGVRAYFATRVAGGPWSTGDVLPGLQDELITSLDISWDGLTLYFNDSGNQLRFATRTTRQGDFSIQGLVLGPDYRYPGLSADGLELYFADNGQIKRVTRTSVAAAFTAAPTTFFNTHDPDLSADGTTLVASKQNLSGVMMATRTCD